MWPAPASRDPALPEGWGDGDDTWQFGPPRRRRLLTWRRLLLAVVAVVLFILLAPTALVDPIVRRVVAGYGGECAELSGVEARSGRWPVVARAATGSLQDVSVEVEEVRFDTLRVRDVSFDVASADVAPFGAALLDPEADVRGGRASGAISFDELERIIAEEGVDLTLRRDGERMVADVEVPPIGTFPTGVEVMPVDGDLEVRLAPLDMVTLPPVRMSSAAPFRVSDAAVDDGAVRVDYTFEGPVAPQDADCGP